MSKFFKLKPCEIEIDRKYQRDLEEMRCKRMAAELDMARIGVPVVARRADKTLVVLDGQHRITALEMAGRENEPILCEVHEGMDLIQEAALFLKLNGGRKAIGVYDKWRARLTANEPIAHEIKAITDSLGLRLGFGTGRNIISAIQAVESVHLRNGNLGETLSVLKRWGDGATGGVFEGELIKYMSYFLFQHADINHSVLLAKLEDMSPSRLLKRIKRAQGDDLDVSKHLIAERVIRDLYNHRNRNKLTAPKVSARSAVATEETLAQ